MAEAEKIRILIVDDIADTRDNLAKLIGFEPDMEVAGTADGGQAAVAMAKKERPDAILMDINMPDMDGITATEIISNTVPESPIIMMSVQGEQDYLRRSMLAGAREFLVKPFSADELINAIRQTTQKPVCLVDGSLPFGDVAVILNMSPKAKTIADLVGSFDNTDADVLESVLVSHSTGIKVLLAPPTPESAELITGGNVKHVLELLRERYAYIVVDTWPSFQEQVITMLDVADVILTLMTLEITSLKNVRVFMEIAEKLGYGDDKVQLVANRNDSSGGIKASDVEASLGRQIPHTIVSDGRTLVLAVNRGVPFVISHRESQVAKDIFTLARKLSGEAETAAASSGKQQQAAAARGGLRLFAR